LRQASELIVGHSTGLSDTTRQMQLLRLLL
jgi:hypothetical protein